MSSWRQKRVWRGTKEDVSKNPTRVNGSRVLVTGAAGFIGSHLVEQLLARGCSVTALDNLSGGSVNNLPLDHPKLVFRRIELGRGDPLVSEAIAGVDFIFHLASPIGVRRAHQQRYDTTLQILRSGIEVVEACRRHRVPLLFTSSSEVYGRGTGRPLRESDPCSLGLEARFGYGSAKLAVEHLVAGLSRESDVPTWIVRFFNVMGARQRPNTELVVASFASAALQNKPLRIHGDGSQQRAFLHVSDAVRGVLSVAGNPDLRGQAVNVGASGTIRIADLAQKFLSRNGSRSPVQHISHREAFGQEFAAVNTREPDTTLLRENSPWHPTVGLDAGIDDCVTWISSHVPDPGAPDR